MGILNRFGLRRTANAQKATTGRTVKVGPGDTLKKIALREYGDENHWERIYEANKWKIDDPDLIYPGMDLRLP
jgi:nucleoid-associated protein YgaU